MALTVGELVGYLRLDSSQWTRALVKARRQLGDADSGLRRFGRSSEVLAGAAVRMGALSAATSVASSAVSGLVAGAAAASGSLLLLPAAATAAVGAFAALKVGAQGFGEALSSMDDPAKFAEAVAELAPAARETAVALRDLSPAWGEVQQATQQALFAGLADTVRGLGATYLPVLRAGLSGIAGQFNATARSVGGFLQEAQTVRDVEGILGGTEAAVGNLGAAMRPLAQVFRDVAAVGSEMLPGLTAGAGAAAQRFADFVAAARESGQLAGWIQGGIEALSTLGRIAGNVGSALGSIFSAMSTSGGGALAALEDMTARLAGFLASAEGSTALGQIFEGLSAAASGLVPALTSVVSTLVTALGPVVAQLGPAVGQLASQVGATLVAAIQLVAPLLSQLAGFLQANMSWIGPLTIAIVGFGAALGPTISIVMGLVNAFKAVTLVFQVLRVALLTNPFTAIITAVVALAVLIVSNWDTIKGYLLAAWEWIKSTAESVWNGIASFFSGIWDSITGVFTGALDSVRRFLSDAWQWCVDTTRNAWDSAVNAVSTGVSNVINFVKELPGKILDALGNLGSLLWDSGRALLQGLWEGIKSAVGWVKDKISGALSSIRDLFPFSPAREGPFSGHGYTTYSGAALTRDFADSIAANGRLAVAAARGVAGGVRSALAAPAIAAPASVTYSRRPAAATASSTAAATSTAPGVGVAELREALAGMAFVLDDSGGRVMARVVNRVNAADRRR